MSLYELTYCSFAANNLKQKDILKILAKSKEYNNFINHLNRVKLQQYDKRIKTDRIYNLVLSDKKNANNKINLILLKKIGESYFERGLKKDEVKKLIN